MHTEKVSTLSMCLCFFICVDTSTRFQLDPIIILLLAIILCIYVLTFHTQILIETGSEVPISDILAAVKEVKAETL